MAPALSPNWNVVGRRSDSSSTWFYHSECVFTYECDASTRASPDRRNANENLDGKQSRALMLGDMFLCVLVVVKCPTYEHCCLCTCCTCCVRRCGVHSTVTPHALRPGLASV